MTIKALVFDMDGTLADSERKHYESWRDTLEKWGVAPFPFEAFVAYVGTSNEQLAADFIASDRLNTTVRQLVEEKQRRYLEMIPDIPLFPGVKTAIEHYCSRYRMAIASSSHRLELEMLLAAHGLSDFFEQIVGGDMVEFKKPAPDIYLAACQLLKLSPRECIAFEDSESGVTAAKKAGMTVVAVPSPLSGGHDLTAADLIVSRIGEAEGFLTEGFSTTEVSSP